jgi:hypothetical protein
LLPVPLFHRRSNQGPRGHQQTEATRPKIGEANRKRLATSQHDGDPRTPDDILDQTMTVSDLVYVLDASFLSRPRRPRGVEG